MGIRRIRLLAIGAVATLGVYLLFVFVAAPSFWKHFEGQPGLATFPMITTTRLGFAGDPINLGLVGSRDELIATMKAAGWSRPDSVNIKSSIKIAGSVALRHSYLFAPVSSLYYQGRRQDLAFEKQQGADASKRHHVRFWKVLEQGAEGRPVWLGAATFDKGVGFSHYTGLVTHHISADVDSERDFLIDQLNAALQLTALYQISGVGPTFAARNGGGDYYYSDGEVRFGVVAPDAAAQPAQAVETSPPALTALKNTIWSTMTAARGK